MTPEDIDKLEACRELDALIAEKVMGWKWFIGVANLGSGPKYRYLDEPRVWNPPRVEWDGKTEMPVNHPIIDTQRHPDYSSDIAAAWEVVEKYKGWGSGVQVRIVNRFAQALILEQHSQADTVPLAICRAALKALSAQQQPQSQQLTELFHNSLTNRGKQVLAQRAIEDLEAQQPLEESECMVGGHAGGCRCHAGEPAKWQIGTS